MLSRKKLFFFADRIAWECNTIESSDVINDGISPAHVSRNPPIDYVTDTTCKVYRTKDSEHRSWTFTVQWYMMRKLTKPHDKLRAIGGLADYQQKALEDQYLAGLWRMFIPAGLLWRRVVRLQQGDGDSGLQDRPIGYRAPSWSWAAIEGEIKYTDLAEEGGSVECAVLGHPRSIESIMKLDIVDAAVTLASPNKPFGGVTGGFIKAMGMMKTIQGNFKPTSHTDFGDMFRLDLSTSPKRSFVDFWPDSITDLPQYGQKLCLLGVDGEGEAEKTGGSMRSKYSFYVRGVALESLPDGNFQRMGFFEYRHSNFDQLIDGFQRREVKIV
ncbi:hypothetical protein BFW01_g1879 [Lasiodiplodia theobromae]|uniref:Uncharacterized protein n=1 Tax=Lasiodiplodia theobromae TaxID=45133 RepID=A0A8H7ISS1_9PEZI|nr:hypothetical protein BFW01_g1879 [Lasiodiplodia theobromae]